MTRRRTAATTCFTLSQTPPRGRRARAICHRQEVEPVVPGQGNIAPADETTLVSRAFKMLEFSTRLL